MKKVRNRLALSLLVWIAFCSAAGHAGGWGIRKDGEEPQQAKEKSSERDARFQRWSSSHNGADFYVRSLDDTERRKARSEKQQPRVESAKVTSVLITTDSGAVMWECANCPQMVLVPAGEFSIGSPLDEAGRGEDEGPQRRVKLRDPIWVSRFEVTRAEYHLFLSATGRSIQGGCLTDRAHKGTWAPEAGTNLNDPGFSQADNHPVVCVTWDDAKTYVDWLNGQTAGGYRLLSEAEWEFAARAGGAEAYPWGPDVDDGCQYANIGDRAMAEKYPGYMSYADCADGALNTAAVGSYRPNAFGIYDLVGNVGEWVEDCASMSYDALSKDGSPNRSGECSRHLVRGASWGSAIKDTRVANRVRYPALQVDDSIGIRVARSVR